jgi:hypothetical protein
MDIPTACLPIENWTLPPTISTFADDSGGFSTTAREGSYRHQHCRRGDGYPNAQYSPGKLTGACVDFGYSCGFKGIKRIRGVRVALGGVSMLNEVVATAEPGAGRRDDGYGGRIGRCTAGQVPRPEAMADQTRGRPIENRTLAHPVVAFTLGAGRYPGYGDGKSCARHEGKRSGAGVRFEVGRDNGEDGAS